MLSDHRSLTGVVLHCQLCEAIYRLMPRLSDFHVRHPSVEVRIVTPVGPVTKPGNVSNNNYPIDGLFCFTAALPENKKSVLESQAVLKIGPILPAAIRPAAPNRGLPKIVPIAVAGNLFPAVIKRG